MVQVYNNINIGSILRSLRTHDQNEPIDEQHVEDRKYLLLLMAKSFAAANKLLYEKKHPNSQQIILVFQLRNGNIRFTIDESVLPLSLLPQTVHLNTNKINYKNNYRLIQELVSSCHDD
jgi:hypothetical protein